MQEYHISKGMLIGCVSLSLLIVFVILFDSLTYNNTRIVFCDVGQGDGIYIRTENNIDILIDAGPNKAIMSCLGKYMPFYDKKIELAFLTHPQIDHYGGYLEILKRYDLGTFMAPPVDNNSQSYNTLKKLIKAHDIQVVNPYAGQVIRLSGDMEIRMKWPSRAFVNTGDDKNVLGGFVSHKDLNLYSLMFLYTEGDFEALFTGDIMPEVLRGLVGKQLFTTSNGIEVLKVPHHGSRNGITPEFYAEINPDVSILSYGLRNRYGHPSPEILTLLKRSKRKYLSTAQNGNIVVEIKRSGEWRILGTHQFFSFR